MSTFLPLIQDFNICLRCQARATLSKVWSPIPPHLQRRAWQSRKFSASPWDHQERAEYNDSPFDDQSFLPSKTKLGKKLEQNADDIRLPDDDPPDNGRRKRAGPDFYFKRANLYSQDALGLTTLGKPAEVIRVRDREEKFHYNRLFSKNGETALGSQSTVTSSGILDDLARERGLVSTERAIENIEDLKTEWLLAQQDPKSPAKPDFFDYGQKLYDGFTSKQLSDYLSWTATGHQVGATDLNQSFLSDTLTRTHWRARTTSFPGDSLSRIRQIARSKDFKEEMKAEHTEISTVREREDSKATVKSLLVDNILRLRWHSRPREELQVVGEMDLSILAEHLELVTSHRRGVLRQIAEEFNAKIDISKSLNVLRITGDLSTCISTLKLIILMQEEIACGQIDLETLESGADGRTRGDRLSDTLLQQIEQSTNTVIRRPMQGRTESRAPYQGRAELSVYYLKGDERSFEDVGRLVSQQPLGSAQPTASLAIFCNLQSSVPTLSQVPVEVGNDLPLSERGMLWSRLVKPLLSKAPHGNHGTRSSESDRLGKALHAVRRHLYRPSSMNFLEQQHFSFQIWHPQPHRELSLVLGRVLYPAKDKIVSKYSMEFVNQINARRAFQTDIPGLRKEFDKKELDLEVEEEIHVRLNPVHQSLGQATSQAHNFPYLELRFSVLTDKQDIKLESMRLIVEDRQADLLLPNEESDYRINSQTYLLTKSTTPPEISNFIKSSNLDVWGTERLSTPNSVNIAVPSFAIPGQQHAGDQENLTTKVDFNLASIEHRSTIHGRTKKNGKETDIYFSLIDAGQTSGRRAEIRFLKDDPIVEASKPMTRKRRRAAERDIGTPAVTALYDTAQPFLEALRPEKRERVQPRRALKMIAKYGRPWISRKSGDVPLRSPEQLRLKRALETKRFRLRRVESGKVDG